MMMMMIFPTVHLTQAYHDIVVTMTDFTTGTSNISQVDVPSTRTTLELVMDPCPAYETATLK